MKRGFTGKKNKCSFTEEVWAGRGGVGRREKDGSIYPLFRNPPQSTTSTGGHPSHTLMACPHRQVFWKGVNQADTSGSPVRWALIEGVSRGGMLRIAEARRWRRTLDTSSVPPVCPGSAQPLPLIIPVHLLPIQAGAVDPRKAGKLHDTGRWCPQP